MQIEEKFAKKKEAHQLNRIAQSNYAKRKNYETFEHQRTVQMKAHTRWSYGDNLTHCQESISIDILNF